MSKVMEPAPAGQGQPPVAPAAPAAPEKPPEPWVLDDSERQHGRWVLDQTPLERIEDQQAATPPAPAPAIPPTPASSQPPPAMQHVPGAAPGQGYQYVLPTGHVLRGASPEAVMKQMEQALINMANYAMQQQRPQEYQRPAEAPTPATTPQRPAFDGKRFYALLADEKPLDAMHELLQEYFGLENPRDLVESSNYAYSHALKMNDRLETADFLSNNPDFPASDQSADVLLKRLDRDNVPLTRWNLEVAFQQLVRENVLQRLAPANGNGADYRANYQQPPVGPVSRGAEAPPLPGASGGAPPNAEPTLAEFDAWSTKDQEAYLRSHGLL